jgi:hypothetical protein
MQEPVWGPSTEGRGQAVYKAEGAGIKVYFMAHFDTIQCSSYKLGGIVVAHMITRRTCSSGGKATLVPV